MKNSKNSTLPQINSHNFKFKKVFGQNFLTDQNLLKSLVTLADISPLDIVLEIGAGAGSLTKLLCSAAKQVYSYEIDKTLIEHLTGLEKDFPNLKIMFKDFLQEDEQQLAKKLKSFKVVANIPYYITTPIVFKLLKIGSSIISVNILVQYEVAKRICAKTGDENYGVLACAIQSVCDVKILKVIDKKMFVPKPKVDSAFIQIIPNSKKYKVGDFDEWHKFLNNCFSMRRKTLLNNIEKNYKINKQKLINILNKLNLNINIRPQQLSIKNFIDLKKSLNI